MVKSRIDKTLEYSNSERFTFKDNTTEHYLYQIYFDINTTILCYICEIDKSYLKSHNISIFYILAIDSSDRFIKIGLCEIYGDNEDVFSVNPKPLYFDQVNKDYLILKKIQMFKNEEEEVIEKPKIYDIITNSVTIIDLYGKLYNNNLITSEEYNPEEFIDLDHPFFNIKPSIEDKTMQNNVWLNKTFKTTGYKIHGNVGNGDCLLYALIEALEDCENNKYKTPLQLRKLVALSISNEIYEEYMNLYNDYKNIQNPTPIELEMALHHIKKYIFLDQVKSIKDFKKTILQNSFWANETFISIIEEKLNVKVIVMKRSGQSTFMFNIDNIMDYMIKKYIIVDLHNEHYQLISYNSKKIFYLNELPHSLVKSMFNI